MSEAFGYNLGQSLDLLRLSSSKIYLAVELIMHVRLLPAILVFALVHLNTQQTTADGLPKLGDKLTNDQVAAFAKLALEGIERQYPNKPANVMIGPESVKSPKELHPAFYG